MFRARYIEDRSIPPFNHQIDDAIAEYPIEGGGNTMVVGIQNCSGDVYRIIEATGMGAYMRIVNALSQIGLVDVLANSMTSRDGYDSLFTIPDELKISLCSEKSTEGRSLLDDLDDAEAELRSIETTERDALVKSRLGQGIFRQSLIDYWQGCAVSDCDVIPILRASHIKPWRSSTNEERLDHYNGLLLAPNLDAVFDSGYISFDRYGKIMLSTSLSPKDAYSLHLSPKMKIHSKRLSGNHQAYLEFHRDCVFKK